MTRKNKNTIYRIVLSALLFVLSLLTAPQSVFFWSVSIAAYLVAGYDVLILAVRKLFNGRALDENFLMSIASVGAMVTGEVHEGIFVMLFYKVGELFECMAVQQSRKSITALLEKMPHTVTVLRDGTEQELTPEAVCVGDTVVLKPGDKAAVDGTVLEGFASMDTSAITGESAPRSFGPGDEIVSGYVSLNGSLLVRAEKEFYDSAVYKFMEMVENATMKKSRAEHFITRFAKVYTPIVVALAACLAIVPPLFGGLETFGTWLHRAFVFLVVSCPCALVISVPLGFFGGIGRASRSGVLIKGSNYIELLSRVHTVAFDKTGTLTDGSFVISNIMTNGMSESEVLRLAGAAESRSAHKLATAITAAAGDCDLPVEDFEELAGRGVRTVVDGKTVLCGCRRWMEESGVEALPEKTDATCIYVASDGVFVGRIELEDALRDNAAQTLGALRKNGVKRICVLTGDYAQNAIRLRESLPLDSIEAGLMPADKVLKIEAYLKDGVTCFVGDGINDAPVLGRADVGFAMGAMGSDAAIEAADVVLLDDGIGGVLEAVDISKKTVRIVKQNVVFALSVKVLVLLLGAFGFAGMWEAVFADVGVSVIAILNSMRLLWMKNKKVTK